METRKEGVSVSMDDPTYDSKAENSICWQFYHKMTARLAYQIANVGAHSPI